MCQVNKDYMCMKDERIVSLLLVDLHIQASGITAHFLFHDTLCRGGSWGFIPQSNPQGKIPGSVPIVYQPDTGILDVCSSVLATQAA